MAGFLPTNSMVFRLLLAVVLLSPLPLGSNRPWAWSLLAVAVGLLLILWCGLVLSGRARAPMPMSRLWAVALPFAVVLGWAFVQTLPVMPVDWAHPLWSEAAHALAGPAANGLPGDVSASIPASISVDPEMTRTALLRLACYGGVFWLAVQLGRDRSRARQVLVAVAVTGIAYATYGLVDHFAGWEHILWLEKWAYPGDLTATFVNRNAYGAYAGLGLLCCMGLFLHALRPSRNTAPRRAYDLAEAVLVRAMPFLGGAVIVGSALLLSHSRGAFLCTGLGLLVLMVAVVVTRMIKPYAALVIALVVVGVGFGVLGLSGDVTVERLASTPAQVADDARNDLYRLTGDAIADAPLTGHGFGAFLPAFRMYRDTSLAVPVVWDFAHNVYLEMAMDLGLPATALLYLSLTVVILTCLRGLLRRRRDHIYPAVALSAATLIGGHGVVDFSAQMPAIAVTLALLLGVGFAQSWGSSDDGQSKSPPETPAPS
jgi:O-antigen ligase